MIVLKAPCYLCGEPGIIEGLCETCYNKEHPLAKVHHTLPIRVCKRCGSVEIPGGWQTITANKFDSEQAIEQQIDILLDMEVHPFFGNLSLTVIEEKKLDRVIHITLIVSGKSHPDLSEHEENFPVELRFRYVTCDTCGLMRGGYYEATLQIRADGRPVTEEEGDVIDAIAKEFTYAAYGKDKKAFILEVNKIKFGFDYFFGSEHLCKRIADEIETHFLVERKMNYKLIGQDKRGKEKFRITILLRLPQFSIEDFVLVSDRPCIVTSMRKGGLGLYDLEKRERFTMTPKSSRWKTLEFLAKGSSKKEFMITSHAYGQPIQLMDSKTFEIVELDENVFTSEIENGATVFMLYYLERYFLLL